jgi:hypothetical protein
LADEREKMPTAPRGILPLQSVFAGNLGITPTAKHIAGRPSASASILVEVSIFFLDLVGVERDDQFIADCGFVDAGGKILTTPNLNRTGCPAERAMKNTGKDLTGPRSD